MTHPGFDPDLFDAAEFGDQQIALARLKRSEVDIDAQDLRGRSALMLASCYGHLEIVRVLLSHGASVKLTDFKGRTALQLALTNNHHAIFALLMAHDQMQTPDPGLGFRPHP